MGVRVPITGDRGRQAVMASYGAFILVGVSAGVGGVILPAQMADYGVDRTKIGITFFVLSAGFFLAGSTAGALIQRLGTRLALAAGAGLFTLMSLYTAIRPPFLALIILQAPLGYGIGLLESVFNAYVAQLPRASSRVNRLHAFFGVGALLGPLLAAWMLRSWAWTSVYLVITALLVPLVAFVLLVFPKPGVAVGQTVHRGLLTDTLREMVAELEEPTRAVADERSGYQARPRRTL